MSPITLRLLSIPATLILALTACTPALEVADDIEFRDTLDIGCGFQCNGNSPNINSFQFPHLHLGGLPNADGVRLLGLRHPQTQVMHTLATNSKSDLVALNGNTVVASGAGLHEWQLVLEKDGVEQVGTIEAHDGAIESWHPMGRPMSAYAISFVLTDSTKEVGTRNACPTNFENPYTPVLTIIRGATYDREEKHVELVDPQWVTFACADEAAYKAKRLGYSQATKLPGTNSPASIPQQDATLKMLTADYCGTGTSYTIPNQDLYWENRAGDVPLPEGMALLDEALWGPNGALCLMSPRHYTEEEIAQECSIPSCATFDLDEVAGAEWATYIHPY